ncbi:MAG TPA: TrkH family potassium uptake protein [Saprospiraceae bacterium]|nr:TrkH family potassium uptake protein [Saprospiraceae bacterium]
MFKLRPVTNVLGILLITQGILMLVCCFISLYYEGYDARGILFAALITITSGALLSMYRRGDTQISKREGYLIVTLGWMSMVLYGMLPYLMTGTLDNFCNALFESCSGFTSTGATVFKNIEVLPHGILFWRSLTQWIGGMGIIVLTVAIFPLLGVGGIELFVAEATGPTSDKIHPRITVTARRLWLVYVGLTGALITLLWLFGMSLFDAFNHAFTTMATGGFSTKNSSLAYYSPQIQWLVILFMFLAGTNYTIIYFGVTGRLRKVWHSDEFRLYVVLIVLLAFVVASILFLRDGIVFGKALRDSTFQVVSVMTTTGFVTADYTVWGSGITMFFFVLLFCGACAGSTSGAIKIVRHLVFIKNSLLEFKRILHPRAVIRIKINKQLVAPRILTHILVFLLVYLAIFVFGTIIICFTGMDFASASGAVASCMGNVGPAIGTVGPSFTFADVPMPAKAILSVLMVLGRLELFTVLVLFTPYFWKKG